MRINTAPLRYFPSDIINYLPLRLSLLTYGGILPSWRNDKNVWNLFIMTEVQRLISDTINSFCNPHVFEFWVCHFWASNPEWCYVWSRKFSFLNKYTFNNRWMKNSFLNLSLFTFSRWQHRHLSHHLQYRNPFSLRCSTPPLPLLLPSNLPLGSKHLQCGLQGKSALQPRLIWVPGLCSQQHGSTAGLWWPGWQLLWTPPGCRGRCGLCSALRILPATEDFLLACCWHAGQHSSLSDRRRRRRRR